MPMTAGKAQSGSRMAGSLVTTLPVVMARKTPLVDWKISLVLSLWRTDRRAARPAVLKIGRPPWGPVLPMTAGKAQPGSRMACSLVTTLPVVMARKTPLMGWK